MSKMTIRINGLRIQGVLWRRMRKKSKREVTMRVEEATEQASTPPHIQIDLQDPHYPTGLSKL